MMSLLRDKVLRDKASDRRSSMQGELCKENLVRDNTAALKQQVGHELSIREAGNKAQPRRRSAGAKTLHFACRAAYPERRRADEVPEFYFPVVPRLLTGLERMCGCARGKPRRSKGSCPELGRSTCLCRLLEKLRLSLQKLACRAAQ
jgi:hypothetical protein